MELHLTARSYQSESGVRNIMIQPLGVCMCVRERERDRERKRMRTLRT